MDIIHEQKEFTSAVIPSLFRRKHIVILPCIRTAAESGKVEVRFVFEVTGPDKY